MTASDSRKVQKIVIDVDPNPVPRDYRFDMELSRDVLRKMFAERFAYSDLTQHDIEALEGFIGIELARYNQECKYAAFSAMHISHRVKFSPTVAMNSRTGGIESAFLFCDCSNRRASPTSSNATAGCMCPTKSASSFQKSSTPCGMRKTSACGLPSLPMIATASRVRNAAKI